MEMLAVIPISLSNLDSINMKDCVNAKMCAYGHKITHYGRNKKAMLMRKMYFIKLC